MQLQLSTWQEIQQRLTHDVGILIPIGSTEQHGPTGLIGTDAICPEVIARGVGDQHDVLVGPTLTLGSAQHHLGFTGTITLRPSTLLAVVRDVVQSLAHHGFRRILFLNGHGGNVATVNAAFSEVYADISWRGGVAPHCHISSWWQGPRVVRLRKQLYGDNEGDHGTCSEISMTQYAYPESIKHSPLQGRAPAYSGIFDAHDYRQRYPDGRIGSDPRLCSPEHGEQLFAAAVADVADTFARFNTAKPTAMDTNAG